MRQPVSFKSIFILFTLFTLGSLISCKKEGCTDQLAENYESKVTDDDGSCIFPRDKFLSSFGVTETCDSGNYTYTISITASETGKNFILIYNFGDYGLTITATVSGSSISFNHTESGVNFSGSGTINGDNLTIDYVATVGGASDTCAKNCIRQ